MPNILVIEDDTQMRSALTRLLETSGHRVTAAANGAEGLRLWREHGADLVLTDIQMPVMNGIEVMLQLRAHAPMLPVLAMSGGDRSRDLDLLGTVGLLGAVGLLQKPFSLSELNAAIAAALQDPDQKRA